MNEKDELTEGLRRKVLRESSISETPCAEAGLTTLSFQSSSIPNRHVWVDTQQMEVDLEDWSTDEEWDNITFEWCRLERGKIG